MVHVDAFATSSGPQECAYRRSHGLRRFLRHVVAALDRTPRTSCAHPRQIASGSSYRSGRSSRVDHMKSVRAGDAAPSCPISIIGGAINDEPSSIVLDHGMHRL